MLASDKDVRLAGHGASWDQKKTQTHGGFQPQRQDLHTLQEITGCGVSSDVNPVRTDFFNRDRSTPIHTWHAGRITPMRAALPHPDAANSLLAATSFLLAVSTDEQHLGLWRQMATAWRGVLCLLRARGSRCASTLDPLPVFFASELSLRGLRREEIPPRCSPVVTRHQRRRRRQAGSGRRLVQWSSRTH